jgi:NADPH-dependent ferric siderophore reductase
VNATTTKTRRRMVDMPDYRSFPAQVTRTTRLSPHFVRITFSGPDLGAFGYAGHDQRVKILLAQPGRTLADLPTGEDWYTRWRGLPDDVRPTMRTYTVRAYRPHEGEIDVDFVLHGLHDDQPGPVSSWAAVARPGDAVALLGPDRPGSGRLWGAEWSPSTSATKVLIAGDETAVPAIGAIVDALPAHQRAIVCAEVPLHADVPAWEPMAGAEVRWLVRERDGGQHAAHGELLENAFRDALAELCGPLQPSPDPNGLTEGADEALLWDVPDADCADTGEVYVWMAGEAGVMKRLRRIVRHDYAMSRSSFACMGYWRQGQSEPL